MSGFELTNRSRMRQAFGFPPYLAAISAQCLERQLAFGALAPAVARAYQAEKEARLRHGIETHHGQIQASREEENSFSRSSDLISLCWSLSRAGSRDVQLQGESRTRKWRPPDLESRRDSE